MSAPASPGALIAGCVRDIPDFPTPGILFKDVTPVLADPAALSAAVNALAAGSESLNVDLVLGAEARGFLFGPAIAQRLGAGFVLARKPGRLPHSTLRADYALEYGTDALEVHADALSPGHRVLVHDDLLATGGTAAALAALTRQTGATVVGFSFLIELAFLDGRRRLGDSPVDALLRYETEEVGACPAFSAAASS